ncbi:heterokaryon incompatibility protein-domain-containing protein [Xylariomycetidae sp. FL0641]|nr:heterokaryon incompatibility protein-domain-containing protein [Xylariomycetidae sp. FL0641]
MNGVEDVFRYDGLRDGEIRLLYHSTEDDESVWSLRTVALSDKPDYDALSYAWGDLHRTFSFRCNGRFLQIHYNLHEALPFLARRDSPRPLWIDAICINQSDQVEKSRTINIMNLIYSRAFEVWVWLGGISRCSAQAVAALPQMAHAMVDAGKCDKFLHECSSSPGVPAENSPVWHAVVHLILHPWSSRLWVLQEVGLARRVRILHGDHEISIHALGATSRNIPTLFHADTIGSLTGVAINSGLPWSVRQAIQEKSKERNWRFFLRAISLWSKYHMCSEPRDRVFGIMGFFTEDERQQIGLDYDSSIGGLYTKFSHFLLSWTRPVEDMPSWWNFLSMASFPKEILNLPSWCPDLDRVSKECNTPTLWRNNGRLKKSRHHYDASRANTVANGSTRLEELKVRGKLFDMVANAFPEFPRVLVQWFQEQTQRRPRSRTRFALLKYRSWEREISATIFGPNALSQWPRHPESISWGKITLLDYCFMLMCVDDGDRDYAYEMYRRLCTTLDQLANCFHEDELEPNSLEFLEVLPFHYEATPMCREISWLSDLHESPLFQMAMDLKFMYLFTSSDGRLGYAVAEPQPSDVICILNTAKTAHVLRPQPHAGEHVYTFVGEAYVYGMMDGEVETLGVEEQDFTLI